MKKVMILGGGYYQLPLIIKSKELGYYTIVVGIDGNYPAYQYADKWYNESTFDIEACLNIAKKEKIDGICVVGTDSVLPTLGKIVDELKLIGPNFQSSTLSSNKALMKKAFDKHKVRNAKHIILHTEEECKKITDSFTLPVVMKIVDASGSVGVKIIKDSEKLRGSFRELIKLTKENYLIVEEFLDGIEFGAQAYVKNNKLQFVFPHGDIIFKGDTGVPIGHYAPYELGESIIDDIKLQLERSITALNINNTAINADFIYKDGKVYVLEIGARAGATCLPELTSAYYGLNYYEYLLKNCVGDETEFIYDKLTPAWVETLISAESGIVKNIENDSQPNEVDEFVLYPKAGDKINTFRNAYDRIGHFVIKSEKGLEHLEKIADQIKHQTIIKFK